MLLVNRKFEFSFLKLFCKGNVKNNRIFITQKKAKFLITKRKLFRIA